MTSLRPNAPWRVKALVRRLNPGAQRILEDSGKRSGKRRREVIPFVKYYLPMRSRLTLSVRTDELCEIKILRASVGRRRLFRSTQIFGQTPGAFKLAPFRIEPTGPSGL